MSSTEITKEQVTAAFGITAAVGEAIRDLGSVPSGELYARLMDKLSLSEYNSVINLLKRSGLVKESGHLLTWTGPPKNPDTIDSDNEPCKCSTGPAEACPRHGIAASNARQNRYWQRVGGHD